MPDPRLEIKRIYTLRGPNIWSNAPIIEAWIDLGGMRDVSSDAVPGFNDRLMSWLPTMIEHRCSLGTHGGFFERLRRGTYPAHILEHVALELQSLAGTPVGYGKARAMNEEGVYRVVMRYVDEALGRQALDEARSLLLAAYDGASFDVAAAVERLRACAAPGALAPATRVLLSAARERGIPAFLLDRDGLLQLGQGSRQRRLRGCGLLTDQTSAVSEELAADRTLYRPVLKRAGIPVPDWTWVESADEAWDAVQDTGNGLPVVVKPLYRDDDPAWWTHQTSREAVEAAFARACAVSSHIVVEEPPVGERHEALVLNGRVIACVAVERPGSNVEPHRQVCERAAEVAGLVGLDVAIVGFWATDPALPLEEQRGTIRYVNSRPDVSRFLSDNEGDNRRLAGLILEALFPSGSNGRVPLVALAGGPERGEMGERVVETLSRTGVTVGHARADAPYVAGRRLPGHWHGLFETTRALIMNPHVDAIVVEVGRRDVLTQGLGFDRCLVAIVTGIDDAAALPLAKWGFDDPADLVRAECCVVDVVMKGGTALLNTADPRVAAMGEGAGCDIFVSSLQNVDQLEDALRKALLPNM